MAFHHKGIEYFIGNCQGKFTIAIPGIKNFFKEYNFKKMSEADEKAKTIIENEISRISKEQSNHI